MKRRTVLLLGHLDDEGCPARDAVRRAGATPVGVARWDRVRDVFLRPDVLAVVFPADLEGFEELCVEVRSELGREDLPLIAVVDSTWESPLDRLFMFSIDDFVTADGFDVLEAKLVGLARDDVWPAISPDAGRVIVADPHRTRRILLGRTLRRKGLAVDFAADLDEVARAAARPEARLILSDAGLPPDGAAAAVAALQAGGGHAATLPWIVCGGTEQLEAFDAEPIVPLRLFNTADPPESVLFLVNEIVVAPPPSNSRKSPRVLYGGPGEYCVVGGTQRVPTFTYNINRTGVYFRTLVPPPVGADLVVDFRPPFGEGRVRVNGRVVWRKECSHQGGPVVPAGMGIIYTTVPLADGAALEAGYDELLRTAPGQRTSKPDEVPRAPEA
jgi:CheY-like chemotaxis protein